MLKYLTIPLSGNSVSFCHYPHATSTVIIFYFKTETFNILLAPKESGFITFRLIEDLLNHLGLPFHFKEYDIVLINTELSAQFMTHVSVSCPAFWLH